MDKKEIYEITIDKWPNKVPIGISRDTYYTRTSKLPKKYAGIGVLKKFGKAKSYYVDKTTGKKIVRTQGKQQYWNLNGQGLYSGNMHWKLRATVVNFYHNVFKKAIRKQLKKPMEIYLNYGLSISVDIYEVYTKFTPDITNMWLLEKMFEDSLQELKLLRDDSPEFVIESGRKRYHWVTDESKRKLVFKIKYLKI